MAKFKLTIFRGNIMVCACVAACCSVLQRIAVCCSVLQCVAVCCSVLQRVAACCSADFHLRQKQSRIITAKLQRPFNWSEAFIVTPIH